MLRQIYLWKTENDVSGFSPCSSFLPEKEVFEALASIANKKLSRHSISRTASSNCTNSGKSVTA